MSLPEREEVQTVLHAEVAQFWIETQTGPYGKVPVVNLWEPHTHYPTAKLRDQALSRLRRQHGLQDLGTPTQTFFRPEPNL